ncbi:MAG: hypothetical protein E6R03_01020 [Hyphomicrobiaceae bacterium]|nr:MAG: hypothetical protein E6R03_01020 [Hyphomicrobiaceae bacterium]
MTTNSSGAKTMKPQRAQPKAMELEVIKARDIQRGVSMVVYGRSGTGKTTIACTAPGPLLLLDIKDEGTDSVSDIKELDVHMVDSLEDFEETYWFLSKNSKRYKTVIIDTCTQLQGMVVAEVMRKNKRKGEPGSWGSMRKQDWGDVSAILKEVLLNYRDLTAKGMNIIFIAQDRTFNLSEEEEANTEMLAPEVGPALSPSVARALNASASIVCNTFIREREEVKTSKDGKKSKKSVIEYCVGIGPSPLYTRKLRKPKSVAVPDAIADCEFADIIEIMKGR